MSRRYDQRTTTFSPDGRLLQVEYAMEAINKAGAAVGIQTEDGVILACEKQDVSALLEKSKQSEKIYPLDKHIYCVVSGMTADANALIDYSRVACQRYLYTYRKQCPVEYLVNQICDLKQGYTQNGGLRPFGTSFLYAGFDKNQKFQLYTSDPSGNYSDYKAIAIGNNNLAANSFLKTDYDPKCDSQKAIELAVHAVLKTMDTTKPKPNQIEVMQLSVRNNEVRGQFLSEDNIKTVLDSIKIEDKDK